MIPLTQGGHWSFSRQKWKDIKVMSRHTQVWKRPSRTFGRVLLETEVEPWQCSGSWWSVHRSCPVRPRGGPARRATSARLWAENHCHASHLFCTESITFLGLGKKAGKACYSSHSAFHLHLGQITLDARGDGGQRLTRAIGKMPGTGGSGGERSWRQGGRKADRPKRWANNCKGHCEVSGWRGWNQNITGLGSWMYRGRWCEELRHRRLEEKDEV